jgi:hypothetical protein
MGHDPCCDALCMLAWLWLGMLLCRGDCTYQAPPSDEGQSCGRTREEKRPHRGIVPRDAMPTRLPYVRLLAGASPHGMLVGSD